MNEAGEYMRNVGYWRERCEKAEAGMRLGGEHIVLYCPNCGDEYLHHGVIEVLSRAKEDGDGVRTVVAQDGSTAFDGLPANSPLWSGRRDEIRFEVGCECCGGRSEVLIMQHKGRTLLSARVLTDTSRVVTYCSFVEGVVCLGIVVLTGFYATAAEASQQAWLLGINPGGEMLTVRVNEGDISAEEFEAYWDNRDRLLGVVEAKKLFEAFDFKKVREHKEP